MIQTASILWAVLATGGAVFVYFEMRADYRWALNGWKRACELHSIWRREALEARETWRRLAIDLQDKIDRDAAKRSSTTSRGNITRAAKRKALVAETTAKLLKRAA